MKIREGLYFCSWCSIEFKQNIQKISGNGKKGRAADQCICVKCRRCISQKTKIELNAKRGKLE